MQAEHKVFGRWTEYGDIWESFDPYTYSYEPNAEPQPASFPTEQELLFASYGGGSYEGDAVIIWERNGQLYEAHASHCSCYGLEGQFSPEETSLGALAMRETKKNGASYYFLSEHEGAAYIAYWSMVAMLQKEVVWATT